MYNVLIRATDQLDIFGPMSLANAEELAHDHIIDLLTFHRGASEPYYLRAHPASTIGTPSHYCIGWPGKYNIYHHRKEVGWIYSGHVYEKKYSVKIIRVPAPELLGLVVDCDRDFNVAQHRARFHATMVAIKSRVSYLAICTAVQTAVATPTL